MVISGRLRPQKRGGLLGTAEIDGDDTNYDDGNNYGDMTTATIMVIMTTATIMVT